jgi:integrase
MARAAKQLHPATKTAVDALKPRAAAPGQATFAAAYDVYFVAPRGLQVRVYPSGTKVFALRYRDPAGGNPPRYRRLILGTYGEITIQQAVERAVQARQRLAAGETPHQDKADRAKIPTVAQLITDYVADLRRTKKPRHADETERLLLKNVPESISKELVSTITPRDLQQLHASLAAHPVTANRTITACSGMFRYAIRRGDISSNPASAVTLTPEMSREVEPLTDAQVAALGNALTAAHEAGEAWQAIALIRFLFFTGCRRSEAEGLQWKEIDTERARVVFVTSKGTRRGTRGTDKRPLGATVLTLLEEINATQRAAGTLSRYVFPKADDLSRPFVNLDRVWQRIRTAAGLPSLRLHDLRHDVASDYGMRYPAAVVKGMAGHATLTSTSKYIHAKDDPMMRAANTVTEDRAHRLANSKAATAPVALHSTRSNDPTHPTRPTRKTRSA